MTEYPHGITHIVGAGLAGLAAAVRLAGQGRSVAVYEAAAQAGGRCRSFHDAALDRSIDNGNHLVMAGNRSVFAYLDEIGARDRMAETGRAAFPFLDLETGERWTVRPNGGLLPWWPLVAARRVAGTTALNYLKAVRLLWAGRDATVRDLLGKPATLFARLWDPLATAALNTESHESAAHLLWPVLAQTFLRGEAYCRPYVADAGLSPALIDPALAYLAAHDAPVHFNHRMRTLQISGGRISELSFSERTIALGPGDKIILAVPPARAAELLPGLIVPRESRAIVNAHYKLDHAPQLPENARFLGLVGGTAHWLFVCDDVASVTVSAADTLATQQNSAIAEILWRDVARALSLDPKAVPPYRIINERRATFAQTPAEVRRRPGSRTKYANLFLAGDWTDTGLPATIESAILSGHRAASLSMAET
ncbi:MAG: hydroxysqualene dehydroxylase HpnE [Alphaproteobacteria bacterium]